MTLKNNIYNFYKKLLAIKGIDRVIKTFLSLSVIQGVSYILPLLLFPFVIRKVGAELFGQFMFSLALINYINLVVEFGFNMSGVRDVASNKNRDGAIAPMLFSIVLARLVLFVVAISVFSVFFLLIEKINDNFYLILPLLIIPVSKIFQTNWYFLGKQKMKSVMLVNFFTKILLVFFTLIFIKVKKDIVVFAELYAVSFLISSLLTFLLAVKEINFTNWRIIKIDIRQTIKSSLPFFLSNLSQSIYLQSSVIILGFFTSNYAIVGYYSIAEKAIRGIRYMITPITQALYPYFGEKFSDISKKKAIIHIKKLTYAVVPILFLMIGCTWIFKNYIILFLVGDYNVRVDINIKILSFLILFGTLNNIWGVLGLINMKLEKKFTIALAITAFGNLVFVTLGAFLWKDYGVSIAVIATEILLSLLLFFNLIKLRNAE